MKMNLLAKRKTDTKSTILWHNLSVIINKIYLNEQRYVVCVCVCVIIMDKIGHLNSVLFHALHIVFRSLQPSGFSSQI